jgi:hypothetical protein
MTQPTGTTATRNVVLPEPGFPMLTRMISNALFPEAQTKTVGCPHCKGSISLEQSTKEEPITWIVGQAHPLVPQMKVMRMFVDRGGVEVYSVSDDGKAGMRNLVPMSWVRLIEEAMPLDVFVEELAAAEEDEPEPEPEPGDPEPEQAPVTNGQTAPS